MNSRIPKYVNDTYCFENSARYYASRPDYPERFYEQICDLLQNKKNPKILDIGCGDGRISEKLAALASSVFALDISREMLTTFKRRIRNCHIKNIHLLHANAEQLPFKYKSIDLLLVGQSFHWMKRKIVLSQLLQSLSPEGVSVIFWIQPAVPLPVSILLTDQVIMKFVDNYQPQLAHDLEPKYKSLRNSPFQYKIWRDEFTHQCNFDAYLDAAISRSYIANFLNQQKLLHFRNVLSKELAEHYENIIEERYCLTAYFLRGK